MRIRTVHRKNPILSTSAILKIEALERRIQKIIAAETASRRELDAVKRPGERRASQAARARTLERQQATARAREFKARKEAPRIPCLALPWNRIPAAFRSLHVGESRESFWPELSAREMLPPDLYAVDPGPPVMVRRIAPDPEEPAGASSEPAAGELDAAAGAQVAPETAPA